MKLILLALLLACVRGGCFDRPVQVLAPDGAHRQLLVNDEGLRQLSECLETSISLIGVVGPYHSGKSFLLNQLAGKNAFKVGPTVLPETLGIWLLPTEDRSPLDGSQIVLVDTEGFFGTDVAESYDANIFAITALLSSHLVYNSIKLVDQAAVDYLELLAQRTRLFSLRSLLVEPEKGMALASRFPPLTWVVEDFTQNLAENTPDSWLQGFLQAKRDSNQPDGLASVFEEISCETLFLPATSLAELQDLSRVSGEKLTLEFTRGLSDLKANLHRKLAAKQMLGKPMGPAQLSVSLRFLAESSNRRKFPELPNYWNSWIRNLTESAKSDTAARLRQLYAARLDEDSILSRAEFDALEEELRAEAETYFQHLVFDIREFYEDTETRQLLSVSLTSIQNEYSSRNCDRIKQFCRMVRDRALRLVDGLMTNLSKGNPQPAAVLLSHCTEAIEGAASVYRSEAGRFGASECYRDDLKTLEESSMLSCELALDENFKSIAHALNSASEAAKSAFRGVFSTTKREKRLLTQIDLETLSRKANESWNLELVRQLSEGPLKWMLNGTASDQLQATKKDIEARMAAELTTLSAENENAIWKEVQKEGEKGLETIRAETRRTLPQSKRAIKEQLGKRKDDLREQLAQFYSAWGELAGRIRRVDDWVGSRLETTLEELTNENTRIYERMFGASTRQCRRDLLHRAEEACPYCKWLLPWQNKARFNEANNACLAKVEKEEKLAIPGEVKTEMLEIWESEELDSRPLFAWTMTLIVICGAAAYSYAK
jgi:hypothetical protein